MRYLEASVLMLIKLQVIVCDCLFLCVNVCQMRIHLSAS